MFCLTDRWGILGVRRQIREGKQTAAESTAFWAEHPNGLQEPSSGLSALLPLCSVQLGHSPSHSPFPSSLQ